MHLAEPYDENNIFANILRHEAPAIRVYEDDMTLAFMDIMPQVPGHVLVIPKSPATNLLTLDPEYARAMMLTTQKVAIAVQQALDAPGFMIAQLNGAAAGQTVFHIHMHILPRREGLEFKLHARVVADRDELEAIACKIRAAL
ncbi:MAG: HIT family protein [Pseudomonadales bacterium]